MTSLATNQFTAGSGNDSGRSCAWNPSEDHSTFGRTDSRDNGELIEREKGDTYLKGPPLRHQAATTSRWIIGHIKGDTAIYGEGGTFSRC